MGDPVVGHKTFSNGHGGFRHEPLRKSEAEAILQASDEAQKKRESDMPDEQSALRALTDAHHRLQDFGWKEWIYMPKDGTPVDLIEVGSSGIHTGHYEGEWPKGSVWIHDEGDLWPSHPILYRNKEPSHD